MMGKPAAIVLGLAIATQPALAGEATAQANGCTACHRIDVKLLGPSYQEVAARYCGAADAKAALIAKVRDGSAGNWGTVVMPPNGTIGDAELDRVIAWVLSL